MPDAADIVPGFGFREEKPTAERRVFRGKNGWTLIRYEEDGVWQAYDADALPYGYGKTPEEALRDWARDAELVIAVLRARIEEARDGTD